jgi:uncharacterized membrane protein YdbT with pleckstrin-like domain
VPFPTKLLNEGEDVVLDTRPNWSLLAGPVTLGLLVVAGLVAGLVAWSKMPLWVGGVIGAAFLVDIGYVLSRYIVWRTTQLVVTTHRVIYRKGVFRRSGREIPIDRVQDVSFSQSLFERMVGAGSLTVESAGEHGQEPFPDVAHPEQLQSTINRLLDLRNQRDQQRASGQPVLSIPEQIEKLGELYRRGILTEDEFEQKKAELLHRM